MWFRVDDTFYDHPKAVGLSDSGMAVWTRSGSWSGRHLTDGLVSNEMVEQFARSPEVARAVTTELIDRRLWEPAEGAVQFHDWADWNPTRAKVLADREADKKRRQRYLDRRRDPETGRAVTGGVTGDNMRDAYRDAMRDTRRDAMRDTHDSREARDADQPDPTRPYIPSSVVTDPATPAHAHARADDDDLINRVLAALSAHGPITRDQAAAWSRSMIDGNRPNDPAQYLFGAIRRSGAKCYRQAITSTSTPAGTRQPPTTGQLCRRCSRTDHRTDQCPTLDAAPAGSSPDPAHWAEVARKALGQAPPDPQAGADPDPDAEVVEGEIVDDDEPKPEPDPWGDPNPDDDPW